MTPPRIDESPRSSEDNSMGSSQNSAFSSNVLNTPNYTTIIPVKQQSLSDDKLHSLYDRNVRINFISVCIRCKIVLNVQKTFPFHVFYNRLILFRQRQSIQLQNSEKIHHCVLTEFRKRSVQTMVSLFIF